MNDFLLALGISVGGAFALSHVMTSPSIQARVQAELQSSCVAAGNQWKPGDFAGQFLCENSSGLPVGSSMGVTGMISDHSIIIPAIVALLVTRSGMGALGAGLGLAGITMYAISGIH